MKQIEKNIEQKQPVPYVVLLLCIKIFWHSTKSSKYF